MKKRIIAMLLVIMVAFACSGCGEELIPLTDSERQQIVYFSAHVIGEFNRSQTEGYMALSKAQLEAIYNDGEEDNAESSEEQDREIDPAGGDGSQEQNSSGKQEQAEPTTLTKALGIDGVKARCTGYDLQKDYVQSGVFAMTASEGKTYCILTVKLENTAADRVQCDIPGKIDSFSLDVNNGSCSAKALITFLPNDLSSFAGHINGGKSKKTILLFEVPEDIAKDISDLSLEVQKGTTKQTILIN
ncbi:MAG: hypothetical protein ACI39H_08480 [Lachnospiraceae bacterium]